MLWLIKIIRLVIVESSLFIKIVSINLLIGNVFHINNKNDVARWWKQVVLIIQIRHNQNNIEKNYTIISQ